MTENPAIQLLKEQIAALDVVIEEKRTERARIFTALGVLDGSSIQEAAKKERGKSAHELIKEIILTLPDGCTFDYETVKNKSKDWPLDAKKIIGGVYAVFPKFVNEGFIKRVPGGWTLVKAA